MRATTVGHIRIVRSLRSVRLLGGGLLVGSALLALTSSGATAQDAPSMECAGGVYEVRGTPLLPEVTFPDAVIIENGTASTLSGCPATAVHLAATPQGTEVRASWSDCGDGLGAVRLNALIGPYCERMTGVIEGGALPFAAELYAALCEGKDACLGACDSNDDCPATNLCERAPGICNGAGLCRPVPPLCSEVARFSCGCDDVTYLNECERRAAGVTLSHDGGCD